MGIKLKVTTRIKINGKEYASVEELPPELRRAYEAALRSGQGVLGHPPAGTRIVFNGTAYDSPEHMPPEVRRLYDLAVAATESGEAAPTAASVARATQELPPPPAPSVVAALHGGAPGRRASPRLLFWLGAALLLALLWVFLGNQGGKPF